MEKLEFIDENGEKTQFYVIEETRINGINYLLVSESDNEDEEAEAYILKDTSDAASEEAVYEFVEEDSELEAVGKVFSELMDDDVLLAGVSVLTIGQYLQPSRKNIPVSEYVTPECFEYYRQQAVGKGFKKVESAPLVRSSYHAEKHI